MFIVSVQETEMNDTPAVNTNLKNASDSSKAVPSKAEGVALCSAFVLTSISVVVGNLLTVVIFVVNKKLQKKSLFLVINMAFADLMLGAVTLPIYIYDTGADYQLWTGGFSTSLSLHVFYDVVDSIFLYASLISAVFISCERFYAIYWPFKHRTLSLRAYRILIIIVWTLAFVLSAIATVLRYLVSLKGFMSAWIPMPLIATIVICSCNIAIWRKFQHGSVEFSASKRKLAQFSASKPYKLAIVCRAATLYYS